MLLFRRFLRVFVIFDSMSRVYPTIAFCVSLVAAGCGPEERNHTAEIKRMEDTIFKSFPTVNRASIEVKDDFGTTINVTLGDETLYNASGQERARVAQRLSDITGYIFSAEKLSAGKVIFVKEETTIDVAPGTEKTVEMTISKAQP